VRLGIQKEPWPEQKLSVIARFVSWQKWVIYGEDTLPKPQTVLVKGCPWIWAHSRKERDKKRLLSLHTSHSQEMSGKSSAGSMFFNVSDSITSLEIKLSDSFHWHACRPLHETVALRVCDTLGSLR